MAILIIAEIENGVLKAPTAAAVTAAKAIGGEIHLLVAGDDVAAAAEAASGIDGVSRVLVAEGVAPLAEPLAALVVGLVSAGGYGHVLAPATTSGKNVAPRIAALLDVAQVSEITAVVDAETFVRPIYAGNALATVRATDPIKVVTVRASAFDAAGAGSGAPVERVEPAGDPGVSRRLRSELTVSERPELGTARVVVSGGRGVGSEESFRLIEALADRLGAAVGASRAAVDSGYAPNDLQVGQTGKVVAPELYIAVGISGAIQHLAGMKDSKVIVAINKDEEAPIFQVADYGLVADLFDAAPALTEALG